MLGGRISDSAKRLLDRLRKNFSVGEFTSTEVYRIENYDERQLRGWLSELTKAGKIEVFEASRGPKPTTYLLATEDEQEVPI